MGLPGYRHMWWRAVAFTGDGGRRTFIKRLVSVLYILVSKLMITYYLRNKQCLLHAVVDYKVIHVLSH